VLSLGRTKTGDEVALSDIERSTHVHVVGATGSGKSKLLEHMVRQDIARGRGLCLVDPHGFLCDAIERWCSGRGVAHIRKIHLIKPGAERWTPGFNPLQLRLGEAPATRADTVLSALCAVWGDQDLNQTPRLRKVLFAVLYALIVKELTLPDALSLLRASDPDGTRRALTADLPAPAMEFVWGELNALSRREFAEYTESTISRLVPLLSSDAVRLMLGRRENALDLRHVMDGGEVVLVNLGAREAFSRESARVVGALLINELFRTAVGRDERTAKQKPFNLYVDEAHEYLSADVARILDETRKFGLHAVLAHQRLHQLAARGDDIYSAVMGSARTKIVFGGTQDEDAAYLARELFRTSIDIDRPKAVLDKPVVVDEVSHYFESLTESSAESRTRAWSESHGKNHTLVSSAGATDSFSVLQDNTQQLVATSAIAGGAESISTIEGWGASEGRSWAEGRSRSLIEGRVAVRAWLPTATYSIDEQLHVFQSLLRSLPNQHAVVKRDGQHAEQVRIADVRPPLTSPALMTHFREKVCTHSPFEALTDEAEGELALSHRKALAHLPAPEAAADVDFWTA